MKKLFKTPMLSLALVAGLTTAFAFTSNASKLTTLTYVYKLSTTPGARNPLNWDPVPGGGPAVGCSVTGDVPCSVTFSSSAYSGIAAYLTAQGFISDDDVINGPGVKSKNQ